MKYFFAKTVFAALLLSLFAINAEAQSLKIGIIDLRKVFDTYYKTKQADTNLKEEAAELDNQRKEMIESFKQSEDAYRDLVDKAADQAVSPEERERSKQTAEKRLMELRELEQTIQQFERTARAQLAEKQRRMRDRILGEIRETINAHAKRGNFTLIIDTAAETVNNTPVVLYNSGENDITNAILTQLNAAAPPGLRE
jgi:outer membrane protein